MSFIAIVSSVSALVLDVDSRESILDATAVLAHGVQELYNGNQTGGTLGKWPYLPYYWWESGGAWGGMMEYWHATKDESYTNVMMEALVSQLGPNYDFNLPEEAFDTGNDDQAFWVFVALAAAEYGFPPPPAPAPDWHVIAQNAWDDYTHRWSDATCGGGLKCWCLRLVKTAMTDLIQGNSTPKTPASTTRIPSPTAPSFRFRPDLLDSLVTRPTSTGLRRSGTGSKV